jgi:hypothetical protein
VWRTGGDPYAEGLAIGQQIRQQRATGVRQPPRLVAAIGVPAAGYPEAAIARRLAGLTRALGTAGIRVRVLPESTIARPADLQRALLPDRYMATVLDGDPARVGSALGVLGTRATAGTLNPDQIVATSPLFDERFQLATGVLGRTGAISSPAEVMPDSADAQLYISQVRTFFRGDRPSIAGLRGYVAGLALGEGMRDGPDAGSIAARLRRPRPFTDALLAPWRASAPGAGAPLFEFQVPRFLSANLLPPGAGGDPHSGTWFDGGAWVPTSSRPLGLTGLIR